MRNQLWNEHGRTGYSTRALYEEFFENFSSINLLADGNKWQGYKLLSRQYVKARNEFQAIRDPKLISDWLVGNQHKLFNAPMIHAFSESIFSSRKPSKFIKFEFISFREENIDTNFYHDQFFEEVVHGPGYAGEFRLYIPFKPLVYDTIALTEALASFGIYTHEVRYGNNNHEDRFLDGDFYMINRDWNFDSTMVTKAAIDEESDYELEEAYLNMSPIEQDRYDARCRAEDIENGEDLDYD